MRWKPAQRSKEHPSPCLYWGTTKPHSHSRRTQHKAMDAHTQPNPTPTTHMDTRAHTTNPLGYCTLRPTQQRAGENLSLSSSNKSTSEQTRQGLRALILPMSRANSFPTVGGCRFPAPGGPTLGCVRSSVSLLFYFFPFPLLPFVSLSTMTDQQPFCHLPGSMTHSTTASCQKSRQNTRCLSCENDDQHT